MKNFKTLIGLVCLCCITLSVSEKALAQPFNSYQSINKHRLYFSIKWNGRFMIGTGYSYRLGSDIQFTEVQAEWSVPFDKLFSLDDYQVIAGTFTRFTPKRPQMALGAHFRLRHREEENKASTVFGLALTALPGTLYATTTSDGPAGAVALRITYHLIIAAKITDLASNSTQMMPFAGHGIEAGGHLDVLLKRALSMTANGYVSHIFAKENGFLFDNEKGLRFNGDFNFGPEWWLDRGSN